MAAACWKPNPYSTTQSAHIRSNASLFETEDEEEWEEQKQGKGRRESGRETKRYSWKLNLLPPLQAIKQRTVSKKCSMITTGELFRRHFFSFHCLPFFSRLLCSHSPVHSTHRTCLWQSTATQFNVGHYGQQSLNIGRGTRMLTIP